MTFDEGRQIGYKVLPRGVPVVTSDGREVGTVRRVQDNAREHIFDGIVIETPGGDLRFVDAPEVARTAERGVTLSITAAEAAELPPPEEGPPSFSPNLRAGKLSRFLGGGWKKR